MPKLNSMIVDLAGQALSSKFSGDKNKEKDQSKGSGLLGGLNLNSAFNQITSTFSGSKSRDTPNSFDNNSSSQNMSGYPPYNNQGYGGGGGGGYGQPPQNQQAYPGYPPSQPPSSGYPGYGGGSPYPPNSGGSQPYPPSGGGGGSSIGFNVDSGPGYPTHHSGPGYPSQGYPPAGGLPYPGSGGVGNAYQPNVGGGGYPPSSQMGGGGGGGGAYPPSQQHQQQPGYGYPPAQNNPPSSVYPTHVSDSAHSFYGSNPSQPSGGGGGGYPGPQRMSHATPSVRPNPNFNANHSAELLRKAMKGFGCNKDKVVQALCTISNWQRQEVAKQFKVMYGKDLISELKSELSGDFEDLILALMEHPAVYDAHQLHKAMAGIGTKESVLIEIMTTRTNAQIYELKNIYRQLYGRDLEKDLIGETSGHFKRLLISLCAGGRDEGFNVDPLRANQDARSLYRAGEQRLGTDESTFNAILASQNFNQLRLVFDEYQKVSGHSIEQAIQGEFSGDIRDGLLAIVKSIRNRPAYFAELLYNSMKGLGTHDTDLIRLVVTRCEIDMADIRNQYQAMFGTPLEKAIAGDCSGAYKEGLITLVKGN